MEHEKITCDSKFLTIEAHFRSKEGQNVLTLHNASINEAIAMAAEFGFKQRKHWWQFWLPKQPEKIVTNLYGEPRKVGKYVVWI